MNKQEAAEFLGVSVRALERYVQQGRISVKYEKGKTRPTANFEQAELEAFREELNQPSVKPAFESRQTATDESRQIATDQEQETGIAVQTPGEITEFGEIATVDRLASIIEGLLSQDNNQPKVAIADKLLLTMAEAQALTGLSREFLKDAIASGELKAKLIGKGWRIKRSDLDEYVDKLF
ncbi:helix-turn-helix domain-containing protein [Anabaena sphaerica FACHB-251]|uniref:Helix-turn-helix domain-containing protein n=1 Tax=Anabaena sphaerica FACHB-251 TaxID=2692883 RepID=A0A926WLQ7_9NOST|nr:helix-turn-helix domain-containing protein [Anabaena sphaerica]MBD2296847.1 helix-turn-helix domain-containing protein [Anabaena sphaerica FACHB-251]